MRGNWFQTNQPDHESDDHAILLCVLPKRTWHFSSKIWSTFVTVLWCSKTEITDGPGYWFLWDSCEIWFPKFTDNFGIVSSKIHLKAVTIFNPIEITWSKMVRSVCLIPVPMATWHLHTLWRFIDCTSVFFWRQKHIASSDKTGTTEYERLYGAIVL